MVARLAHQRGLEVEVRSVVAVESLQGTRPVPGARRKAGVSITDWNPALPIEADVVVDALLGIGLSGEVRSPYREVIESLNQRRLPVLSIDVPSGLCAQTGRRLGTAVNAEMTLLYRAEVWTGYR